MPCHRDDCFHNFAAIFHQLLPRLLPSDASPCDPFWPRWLDPTSERGMLWKKFLLVSRHFRHIQKKGPNYVKSLKRKDFNCRLLGPCCFFLRKSDVFEMRKFSFIRTLPKRGSYLVKKAVFSTENVPFWRDILNEISPWWAQMAAEDHHRSAPKVARPVTIRNVKNTCSSSSSSYSPLPPSPFPSTSFLSSWTPKTQQFLGKNAKIVMMMSVFDPHRGSYSLGLLRRYTLYVTLPNSPRVQSVSEEQSRKDFLSKETG